MRRTQILVVILLIILVGISYFAVTTLAPEISEVEDNTLVASANCLTRDTGTCLQLPTITGTTINTDSITFPDVFQTEYQLVVMPFDREQQVLAATWLPIFQEIASENPTFEYWSIAALPDLNTAVRALVIGGTSIGVQDEAVRSQIALLFLDDQQAVLDALNVPDIEQIQIFIMDRTGTVYYRDVGEYTEMRATALREAIIALVPLAQ